MNVLVLDDDREMRASIRRLFYDSTVTDVSTPLEAMRLISAGAYDVCIIDNDLGPNTIKGHRFIALLKYNYSVKCILYTGDDINGIEFGRNKPDHVVCKGDVATLMAVCNDGKKDEKRC